MTPPAVVAPPPRDPCVEPYADVQGCVDELWTAAGYGWELWFMHAVVQCESGWQPWETGRAGEAGLFQIHPVNWHLFGGRDPWDVVANTEVALVLRRAAGWAPWSCSRVVQ